MNQVYYKVRNGTIINRKKTTKEQEKMSMLKWTAERGEWKLSRQIINHYDTARKKMKTENERKKRKKKHIYAQELFVFPHFFLAVPKITIIYIKPIYFLY